MSRILVFAGTTEGRKVAEKISLAGASALVCVATEYGETLLEEVLALPHLNHHLYYQIDLGL